MGPPTRKTPLFILVLFTCVPVCFYASRSKLGSFMPLLKISLLCSLALSPAVYSREGGEAKPPQQRRWARCWGDLDRGEGTEGGHEVGTSSPERQRPWPLNPEGGTGVPMLVGIHPGPEPQPWAARGVNAGAEPSASCSSVGLPAQPGRPRPCTLSLRECVTRICSVTPASPAPGFGPAQGRCSVTMRMDE